MSRRHRASGLISSLDTKWQFMHRLQAGAFAVLIAGSVVGVSALATQTTKTTERPVASTTTPRPMHTTSLAESGLNEQPKATAQPLAVATEGSTAIRSESDDITCNLSLKRAAIQTRATRLSREADRHQHVLWSLQTTGLVTRFLNPNMYTYRLDHETAQHQQALQRIQNTYQTILAHAHC